MYLKQASGVPCVAREIKWEGETSAREIFPTPLTFCFHTSGPSGRDASANVGILVSDSRKSCLRQFPLTWAFGYCGGGELVQVLSWPSGKARPKKKTKRLAPEFPYVGRKFKLATHSIDFLYHNQVQTGRYNPSLSADDCDWWWMMNWVGQVVRHRCEQHKFSSAHIRQICQSPACSTHLLTRH